MASASALRGASRAPTAIVLATIWGLGCQGTIGELTATGQGGAGVGNRSGAGGSGAGTGAGNATGGPGASTGTAGTGAAGSGGPAPTGAGGTGATPGPTVPAAFGSCPSNGGEPGVSPLTKLSTLQYRNTVRDLLAAVGLAAVATEVAPMTAGIPDDSTVAFRGLDARVTGNHVQGYFNVAVAVADAATSTTQRLTALAGTCAGTSPLSMTCLNTFLAGFGRRAYRRPLDTDELTALRAVGTGTSPAPATAAEAIRNVLVVMLMSPRFVNHLELAGSPIGGREDYLTLDPYEVASRLSYTFWQTLPDDGLLAAAADGSLGTDAGFATQLDRVFADARTKETIWQFWNEWLRFESFTGFADDRPAFAALAKGEQIGVAGHDHWGDMVREIRDLTDLYTWSPTGARTFRDLMTSDLSVTRSADLARLYGVPVWAGSGDYPRFPAGTRTGLLQRAALLASSLEQTNPFHRGALIRRAILCDDLPQPNPNSLPSGALDPPPASTALTTRERFAAKVDGNGLCQGCHASFSDLGYVMEAFDALGRYRTAEKVFDEQTGALLATLPINTGAVVRVVDVDTRPVSGPAELNERILESGKAEGCLSANYFRYALRRDPTRDSADACAYEAMRTTLSTPGAGLADVFRNVAQQTSFRRRRGGTP